MNYSPKYITVIGYTKIKRLKNKKLVRKKSTFHTRSPKYYMDAHLEIPV